MDSAADPSRPPRDRGWRRRGVFAAVVLAALLLAAAAFAVITTADQTDAVATHSPHSTAPDSRPTASPTPGTPAEALLATTDDPEACAVSFDGDAIAEPPMLQTQGVLYAGLPIPVREGSVFAGWYESAADAASFRTTARVNGSELVACADRQITLHASWKTPEQNAAEGTRIPILTYHQFTTAPEGKSGPLRDYYLYIGDFAQHIDHIASTGFYLPTWDELSAFIDGRLFLPDRSVIVTDDDAGKTWFALAAPIVGDREVLTTSFMITAIRQDEPPNPYVLRRSHTHDMHRRGADGNGLMVNLSAAEIAADMEASAQVLDVKEVMAYPYGNHDERTMEGLRLAGFEMARTTTEGFVTIGAEKLELPTLLITYGTSVADLIAMIG